MSTSNPNCQNLTSWEWDSTINDFASRTFKSTRSGFLFGSWSKIPAASIKVFFIRIHVLFPEEFEHSVRGIEKKLDPSIYPICNKGLWGLLWAKIQPLSRFNGNPPNQPTHGHRCKHNLVGQHVDEGSQSRRSLWSKWCIVGNWTCFQEASSALINWRGVCRLLKAWWWSMKTTKEVAGREKYKKVAREVRVPSTSRKFYSSLQVNEQMKTRRSCSHPGRLVHQQDYTTTTGRI